MTTIAKVCVGAAAAACLLAGGPFARADDKLERRLKLVDRKTVPGGSPVRAGKFRVYENRKKQAGRVLELDVVVLPRLQQPGEPDPVFVFAGGPGQNVATHVGQWEGHWMRKARDIVLVSQRGTGGDNRLQCDLPGSDDDLQGYFEPFLDQPTFRACLEELRKRADLTQYSTPTAMDDVNDLRAALGYDKINLYGGSYGSRAELVYLRRHPRTVRCAIMNSVAPIAFRNPLYHARAAQEALDTIFEMCAADPEYRAAFGDLRAKFRTVLQRLDKKRAKATVSHPKTGKPVELRISREAFAEGLRVIMYGNYTQVPLMILRAHDRDFDLFARQGLRRNRSLRHSLAFGMLLCVTCAEDVARIDPDEIERETRGTFLGDGRVRRQIRVCRFWPKSDLPDTYGEPVRGDVPVLLLSGTLDSVTPPKWGAEAARHLTRSTHVAAPGSHGLGGACITSIMREFLTDPDRPVNTSCVDKLRYARFQLP